jgi:hypothetical protein
MSDDFGTVSVGRGDRAREIEAIRAKYRAHRETLQKLAADAPTDLLATEYHRLLGDIETALAKLDELDVRRPTASGSLPVPPPPRARTSAGDMPLATPPRSAMSDDATSDAVAGSANPASRVAIIVVAGLIVLGAIVWLIWRGSERHGATTPVVEQPSTVTPVDTAAPSTAATTSPEAPTAQATAALLKVTPAIADYGTIQKGTRAVRQFEVMNNGSKPITVQVSRSTCRCLYYDYHDKVGPKKKETLTVTVDGAKAKEGTLRETLTVTTKENHSITAEMTVQAIIK